jgi:hypothetical protein
MTLFTWLTLVGFGRFELKRFERWESGLLGTLFLILGIIVLALRHEH